MGFIEGIQALNEPATKLIEAVSHAIGKVYEPRYIKKIADAKAYEIKRISEELRNNSDLPIVYDGTKTTIDSSSFDELVKRTGNRLAYQEIKKQENIEAVIDKTLIELDGEESQTKEEINPDWMNKYINSVGEISADDMQQLWIRILKGEVLSPNSFSIKTLDCLSNMNTQDAKQFETIAQFVVNNRFLVNYEELNKQYGIYYSIILALDDCGLINSGGTISYIKKIDSSPIVFMDFRKYIIIASSKETRTITVQEYPLSRAGKELFRIIDKEDVPIAYVKEILSFLKEQYKDVVFSLHQVLERIDEDRIRYNQEELN